MTSSNFIPVLEGLEDSTGGDDSDKFLDVNTLRFMRYDEQDGHNSLVFISPNGTQFWCPDVKTEDKPLVGTVFENWDDAQRSYKKYASLSGFSTRISTSKNVAGFYTLRYLLCNRAGKPQNQDFDTMDPSSMCNVRYRIFTCTNCPAFLRMKAVERTSRLVVYKFMELHNHPLVSGANMDLLNKGKDLNYVDVQFIHRMLLNKVGPNVAHRIYAVLNGGHHNLRGTRTSYKNVSRDIRVFIGDRDAQMVINTLEERRKNLHNFSFQYSEVNGELRSVFWADDVMKTNYIAFGDVLAFDATYQTNTYNMIFVPFTGVDLHKKCVTFATGLIYNETGDSYKWLLQCFIDTHVKQPKLVLTDQDLGMKQAINFVLKESKHRLCMWHIMKKLPVKIIGDLLDNTDFRSRLHNLVWSVYMKETTFEERWKILLEEFGLKDHDWLNEMFKIRGDWVPAYFRDIDMCCLMKTTSRCESSNAQFKINSTAANTLVQFLMCFDTTIDHQRYTQREEDYRSNTVVRSLKTTSPIEIHARDVYTLKIYIEVQTEISIGHDFCMIASTEVADEKKILTVSQSNPSYTMTNDYKVTLNINEQSASCSCMCFTRIGYLCRHIFCVFRFNNIVKIPEQYILRRWTKGVLPSNVYSITNRYGVDSSKEGVLRDEIMDLMSQCMDRLRLEPDGMSGFADQIREITSGVFEKHPRDGRSKKRSYMIGEIIKQPAEIEVFVAPPQGIKTKGSGKGGRIKSAGEKAIQEANKTPRLCKICMTYVVGHDSRNCPEKESVSKASSSSKKATK